MDISLFMLTFPIFPSIHPSTCKYHNISLSAFVLMSVFLIHGYMIQVSKSICLVALYCLMAFQLSVWLKSLTSYSLLRALNLSCMFIRLTSVSLCFYRYIASDMRVNCKRAKKNVCSAYYHLSEIVEDIYSGIQSPGEGVRMMACAFLCLLVYLTECVGVKLTVFWGTDGLTCRSLQQM